MVCHFCDEPADIVRHHRTSRRLTAEVRRKRSHDAAAPGIVAVLCAQVVAVHALLAFVGLCEAIHFSQHSLRSMFKCLGSQVFL